MPGRLARPIRRLLLLTDFGLPLKSFLEMFILELKRLNRTHFDDLDVLRNVKYELRVCKICLKLNAFRGLCETVAFLLGRIGIPNIETVFL